MTLTAILAVTIAAGTWFAIRWTEETQRIDRTLTEVLMSIDFDEDAEVTK